MISPSPAEAFVVGALVIAGVGAVAGKGPGKRTETEKKQNWIYLLWDFQSAQSLLLLLL